ncbi:hypothetical protein [Moorena sp. SIOASIH]|nr:hypothetical protein [Moorena sp. SIOASIH]
MAKRPSYAIGRRSRGARSHFPTTPKLFPFFPIPDSRFPIPDSQF